MWLQLPSIGLMILIQRLLGEDFADGELYMFKGKQTADDPNERLAICMC